jgi:replication factor C subunit 3/5
MNKVETLDQLTHNKKLTDILKKISQTDDFPNLLFYGPSGSGKHTRIRCFLSNVYGTSVHNLKTEYREYKIQSKSLEIQFKKSFYHIEINPSLYGNNDKFVVQEIIKDIAQTPNINTYHTNKTKIIVIDQADKLTKIAQNALRRTMEIYNEYCKIILVCQSLTKIIKPLQSRCLCLRVAYPNKEEMKEILKGVKEEKKVDVDYIVDTVKNIKKAKVMKITGVTELEWERCLDNLVKNMHIDDIIKIREKFYLLLGGGVPDYLIFRTLVDRLIKLYPEKYGVILQLASTYQVRSLYGQKSIYHLEAFVQQLKNNCV